MALERQCPRGEPRPFVHYRRRFADRAALFSEHFVLLIEAKEEAIAVASIGIKKTDVKGNALRVAYIFDVRVAPHRRRQGLASVLLESIEEELIELGCDGAYAHIVSTNKASLRLFVGLGYQRRRQMRYLTYQPFPLMMDEPVSLTRLSLAQSRQHKAELNPQKYAHYDLFDASVPNLVTAYDFEHWQSPSASLNLFDQNQVFQQYPADLPWPTPREVRRRGGHWRIFHPEGDAKALEALFKTMRDQAIVEKINKISMLVDAEEPIPSFFFAETSSQRTYIIVTHSFTSRWDGGFGKLVYCDPREL
jgi:GNAT superfamily N-acetyltransferase